MKVLAITLVVLLSACCSGNEGPQVTLLPDTVVARMALSPDRFDMDGWLLTGTGYSLRFDKFEVQVDQLELEMLSAPPKRPQRIGVHLEEQTLPVNLQGTLGGGRLGSCVPSCVLPPGYIGEITIHLDQVRAMGLVRDAEGTRLPGAVPFELEVRPAEPVRVRFRPDSSSDGSILAEPPETLVLSAILQLSPLLFDSVDFGILRKREGVVCLSLELGCTLPSAYLAVSLGLSQSALVVDLSEPSE